MSKRKCKSNLGKIQTRRKSISITDICSQSKFLCGTPDNLSNVLKQLSPQTPNPLEVPNVAKPKLSRKSLRISNQSMPNVSETPDHKQAPMKSNVSKKFQLRRELFKKQMSVSSMKSSVDNNSKLRPPSITSTSITNQFIKPGSACKDFKDLAHRKKMEILENNNKKGHKLRNNKFHQEKPCPISQQCNTDASVLSVSDQSILKIKRMSKEEVLSMKSSELLSRKERLALRNRQKVLRFCHSVRVKSPSRTPLSLPSSPTTKPARSIRKHSPQPNHNADFTVPMNFTRESLSKGLYHQSPSKYTTDNNAKQVPKQETAKAKVSKVTNPTTKSTRKPISKEPKSKQEIKSTALEPDNPLKLARPGTLKRKRQIREILATHNSTRTLLESTPMKSLKLGKIAFVDAMSPMKFGTPTAPKSKRKKNTNSPTIFSPTNRANQDRYIKELARRNKKNVEDKRAEMSGESSQMISDKDVNKLTEKDVELEMVREPEDSDVSVDEYFSSVSESE